MPNYKNSLGGRTTVDPGSNCNRVTVRDRSGKVVSKTETHGSYVHTVKYDRNGKATTTYRKVKK